MQIFQDFLSLLWGFYLMHHLQIVLLGKIHIIAGLNVNEFQLMLSKAKAICKFKRLRVYRLHFISIYLCPKFPKPRFPDSHIILCRTS